MSRISGFVHLAGLGFLGLGATLAAAQPAPPPTVPPPALAPPDGGPQNGRPRRAPPRTGPFSFDSVPAIPEISMIDDPVTGFGNEAFWSDPEPMPEIDGSDIAVSANPD